MVVVLHLVARLEPYRMAERPELLVAHLVLRVEASHRLMVLLEEESHLMLALPADA